MVDRHSGCPIPDGQDLKSEIQKDGSKTLYYVNLGTGIRVNSVEDMFCYKNSKSRENNPKQNYVNLGTGIRVNSVEDIFRYKDRESGENTPKQTGGRTKVGYQFCSQCKEVGHNIFRCPLAINNFSRKCMNKMNELNLLPCLETQARNRGPGLPQGFK
ncbi:uncharacterized protein LOC117619086 isoform X1 [Prunus dulcis]|uniref:uncharacterized protein LOC117619086 isoform X1 n=1 Tax=Prunus dulcis TaxID=3755 RepID=UPI001482E6FC|nr:uncharacterized protein LOC117619086 isoform X1 [Prunus dulcis]